MVVEDVEYEIPERLENVCKELIVHEKNWKKYKIKGIISAILALVTIIVAASMVPENKTAQDVPEISITAGTICVLLFGLAGYFQTIGEKKHKNKLRGFDLYTLLTYNALELFKKFEKNEPDFNYITEANDNLNSVVDKLKYNYSTHDLDKPDFKSIHTPIMNFIEVLKSNFVPSITDIYDADTNIDKKKILSRKNTLKKLIMLFQSENFHEIESIITELKDYKPITKPKKKSRFQKIRENATYKNILLCIIGSIIIIILSIVIAHLLSSNPASNTENAYDNFVSWTLIMSIGGLSLYNYLIFKK